ncbi:histidine kinase [Chondrocystis sp. NIES-4102]|nr:histidine kinase [Chondrocystis sp. NIES-4102]
MTFGQSSFRRILLSRILLVSVPVLLLGVYVTYRKARSAFLETARQNLTESAVRKGESIKQSIEALQSSLASASDAVMPSSDVLESKLLIAQLQEVLPKNILCIQVSDLNFNKIITTTCKESIDLSNTTWRKKKQRILTSTSEINVKLLLPSTSLTLDNQEANENPLGRQLKLWLTAPIYDRNGNLRYALSVKSAILAQEIIEPGSLEGYPVVINQDGTILAHPFVQRVGRNIKQMPDAQRLSALLANAISDQPDFLHLFYLETDGIELLAGYSSIPSPVTNSLNPSEKEKWIILAVSPIDAALVPLKDIRRALVAMTLGLIAACSVATLYVSRELARPLERIRDYSLREEHLQSNRDEIRLPENFQIREFNQLSTALNEMVSRLRTWGDEIVSAWKAAQTANQLKSEFLATTSHELRTPLNGIINCIRIVQDGYCDSKEEEQEFLKQADDAAIHLLGIINDVLDISKIEAGKLSVNLEQVDLYKVIDEVVDLHLVAIQRKNLDLIIPDVQENLYVIADAAKLKQVLINLVSNAVKFTDYGSIKITITTKLNNKHLKIINYESNDGEYLLANENSDSDNYQLAHKHNEKLQDLDPKQQHWLEIDNYIASANPNRHNYQQEVVITVEDTGIGIDKDQQSKLFNPFVMVDGSTTRKFGGTGLGLAISRNLVELMQGTISLESAGEGKGTTIRICLPLA